MAPKTKRRARHNPGTPAPQHPRHYTHSYMHTLEPRPPKCHQPQQLRPSNAHIIPPHTHAPPPPHHHHQAVDVYSFGVLLFEMYAGHRAWCGQRAPQIVYLVGTLGQRLHMPPTTPDAYQVGAVLCRGAVRWAVLRCCCAVLCAMLAGCPAGGPPLKRPPAACIAPSVSRPSIAAFMGAGGCCWQQGMHCGLLATGLLVALPSCPASSRPPAAASVTGPGAGVHGRRPGGPAQLRPDSGAPGRHAARGQGRGSCAAQHFWPGFTVSQVSPWAGALSVISLGDS